MRWIYPQVSGLLCAVILSTDDALKVCQVRIYCCLQLKLHNLMAPSLVLVEIWGQLLHHEGVWSIMLTLL